MKTLRHIGLYILLACTILLTQCSRPQKNPTVQRIQGRGTLLVGTTGDYRPLSFKEENGEYWGFGIDLAGKIAERLKVNLSFVQTSWPTLVAEGQADVMITEVTEAPWYVQNDNRLAAPLLNAPFTDGEIGVLMRKGQEDLLELVNTVIHEMKADGSLRNICNQYGLVYAY